MMFSALLYWVLTTTTYSQGDWKFSAGPQAPSPYMGYTLSAFSRTVYDPKLDTPIVFRGGGYLNIGLPFEIARWEAPSYVSIPLVVTPEIFFGDSLFGVNGSVGPEIVWKTGYRQTPSAFFLGLAPGFFFGYNTWSGKFADGSVYSYQKVSAALLGNIYGGPSFHFWRKSQARIIMTIRPMYGTIGERAFSMGANYSFAMTFGAFLQIKL